MSSSQTFILEASTRDNRISVGLRERGSTVHQYEDVVVAFQEIDNLCGEIITLLNKANEKGTAASGIHFELKKVGQVLYDQLLPNNVKHRLKNTKIENLLILIDENLVHIPWELLNDGDQFLCLKFNMGRNVRTRQTLRASSNKTIDSIVKMLILADPTNDLKSARKEASLIEKELDRKQKRINVAKKVTDVSMQYLKKNIRDYDIVHFAGHADYDNRDPSNSGWRLADGRITAKDIVNMGSTTPLPSLVFSNSCQSAQTEKWLVDKNFEKRIYGLANAFLLAGVRHYIGNFWKIPDEVSLDFAKDFYYQITEGKSIGEAIKLARLSLYKKYGQDTIIWANYILYGDPLFYLFKPEQQPLVHFRKKPKKIITVLTAIGIGLLIFRGIFIPLSHRERKTTKSIAVFPFQNINKNVKDNWLSWGTSEVITNKLSKIRNLDVLTRAALQDIGDVENLDDNKSFAIGRKLGLDMVIMGSYQRSDGKLRIIANILDTDENKIIKSIDVVGDFTDIDFFKLQNKVAYNLIDALDMGKTEIDSAILRDAPTNSLEAYQYFSQTWSLFVKGRYEEAKELCLKALEKDKKYLDVYKRLGNIYDRLNSKEKALEAYRTYKQLSEEKGDKNNFANSLLNIGWILQQQKNYNEAIKSYDEGLKNAIEVDDYLRIAKAFGLMSSWYLGKGNYERAKYFTEKSIDVNKTNAHKYDFKYNLAGNYTHLAMILSKEEDFDAAVGYYKKAENIYSELNAKIGISDVYYRLGLLYAQLGNTDIAKDYFERSKLMVDKFSVGSAREQIQTTVTKSGILKKYDIDLKINELWADGKKEEAIDLCKKALEEDPSLVEIRESLGNFYEQKYEWDKALQEYLICLGKSEAKQDYVRVSSAYRNIGWVHDRKGDYQKALYYYNKALHVSEKNNYLDGVVMAYSAIGLWYLDRGEFDDSLKFLNRSKELSEERGQLYDIPVSHYNLGYAYTEMAASENDKNKLQEAVDYYNTSLEYYNKLEDQDGIASCLLNIGVCYYYMGNYRKATKYYNDSMKIFTVLSDKEGIGAVKVNLVEVAIENKKFKEVEVLLNEAEEIFKDIENQEGLAIAHKTRCLYYMAVGDIEKAKHYIKLSKALFDKVGMLNTVEGKRAKDIWEKLFEK